MKKYVMMVKGIEDMTGAPRYVNNKCRYLKTQGWEVYVFWSYNVSHAKLEYLIPFDNKDYVFHELQYYPCWFTKRQRAAIVEKIANKVGTADQIVVESNKIQLGAWGEMLAKRLQAKHINFITTEGVKLKNKDTFDFCYAKLQRKEFFNISMASVKRLFSGFIVLEHPEDNYWSAMQNVECEEYPFPSFDNMPKSDYTIVSFGRSKGYFPYMLDEVDRFVSTHSDKTFNIFFLGDLKNPEGISEKLKKKNVNLVIYPQAVAVVPKQIFTKSDVIIATAGCAYIAAENGGKVISIDITHHIPLGYYGVTTWDSNTRSSENTNDLSLSEWLEALVIEKRAYEAIPNPEPIHGFDYHMRFITAPDGVYLDSSKVREKITRYDTLCMFLTKIGLFKVVDYWYFSRRGGQLSKKHQSGNPANDYKGKNATCIVEFNGLPGLGKTTIANILIDELRKDGFKVIDRKYNKNLLWRLAAHFPKTYNLNLYRIVKEYADTIPSTGGKRTHVDWTNRYALKYWLMKRFSGADYAIIDEALIQFLVAMGFKDKMPESGRAEAIVRKIKDMGVEFIRVDCVNNVEEASKRLLARPARGLVFEKMSREELLATLETEKANFDYFRELFSKIYNNQLVIEIDTREDPHKNAMIIKEAIKNCHINE